MGQAPAPSPAPAGQVSRPPPLTLAMCQAELAKARHMLKTGSGDAMYLRASIAAYKHSIARLGGPDMVPPSPYTDMVPDHAPPSPRLLAAAVPPAPRSPAPRKSAAYHQMAATRQQAREHLKRTREVADKSTNMRNAAEGYSERITALLKQRG